MISVIMSTYNETEEEINESINSIINQTISDIEFIIVDDNPDNDNLKINLEKWATTDERIIILHNNKNIGLVKSLNRALGVAKGEYIARMDADDISFPLRFEKEIEFAKKWQLDLVASNVLRINEHGEILPEEEQEGQYESKDVGELLKFTDCIRHPTVIGRKECFLDCNGYRELVPAEDYDLWLRMRDKKYKIGIIGERLLKYRVRHRGISQSNLFKQYIATEYIKKANKKNRISDEKIEKEYNQYLEEVGIFDEKKQNKYKKVQLERKKMLMNLKKRKPLNVLQNVIKLSMSVYGRNILYTGLIVKMIKMK